jgi:hypothetical protein
MIFGICGPKGSGKNTIGEYLSCLYGYKCLSFASILKDVISIIFGWDRKMLEGLSKEDRVWRETVDEWWSERLKIQCTPRWVMQNIGTDVIRKHFNDNIWIYALEKQMTMYENIVITDVRFPNEIEFLLEKGAVLMYANRNCEEWIDDPTKIPRDLHISEWAWVKYKPEICIDNYDSIDVLHSEIENKLKMYL